MYYVKISFHRMFFEDRDLTLSIYLTPVCQRRNVIYRVNYARLSQRLIQWYVYLQSKSQRYPASFVLRVDALSVFCPLSWPSKYQRILESKTNYCCIFCQISSHLAVNRSFRQTSLSHQQTLLKPLAQSLFVSTIFQTYLSPDRV